MKEKVNLRYVKDEPHGFPPGPKTQCFTCSCYHNISMIQGLLLSKKEGYLSTTL